MSTRPSSGPVVCPAAVGVGCYLRYNSGGQPHKRPGRRALDPEDSLEGGERYLRLLPHAVLAGALGHQIHPSTGQPLASVGQVPKQPPRKTFAEPRTTEQLTDQSDFRDVGRGQFVGEGHAVGGAQEVKLVSANMPVVFSTLCMCRGGREVRPVPRVGKLEAPTADVEGGKQRMSGSKNAVTSWNYAKQCEASSAARERFLEILLVLPIIPAKNPGWNRSA